MNWSLEWIKKYYIAKILKGKAIMDSSLGKTFKKLSENIDECRSVLNISSDIKY